MEKRFYLAHEQITRQSHADESNSLDFQRYFAPQPRSSDYDDKLDRAERASNVNNYFSLLPRGLLDIIDRFDQWNQWWESTECTHEGKIISVKDLRLGGSIYVRVIQTFKCTESSLYSHRYIYPLCYGCEERHTTTGFIPNLFNTFADRFKPPEQICYTWPPIQSTPISLEFNLIVAPESASEDDHHPHDIYSYYISSSDDDSDE